MKAFFNVNFKIEQCQDEVYDSDSSSSENEGNSSGSEEGESEQIEDQVKEKEEDSAEKPAFAQTFIFSCIGIGLTNFARRIE